jgi:hypothetical protein
MLDAIVFGFNLFESMVIHCRVPFAAGVAWESGRIAALALLH